MSLRALRKLGLDSTLEHETLDKEEEEEEEFISGPTNAFSLLEVENGDSEHEEEEEFHVENEKVSEIPRNIDQRVKKTRKKSKKKKNTKTTKETEQNVDFDFPVDEPAHEKSPEKNIMALLTVTAANLNAEAELRRLFGSSVVRNDRSVQRVSTRFPGRFLLAVPNNYWPTMERQGLSMRQIQSLNSEENVFSFCHSATYQKLECRFLQLVSSMIPELLVEFSQQNTGHTSCYVMLSFISSQTGDFNMATEYLSRAFFTFEKAFDLKFALISEKSTISRLPYERYENRPFYLALFQHISFLQRKGCWKTAFECCKATIRLSEEDPLGMWLLVDYLALRANDYQFILNVVESAGWNEKFSHYYTWKYSIAIAQLMEELHDNFGSLEAIPSSLEHLGKSHALLKKAIETCPSIILTLSDDCGVYIQTSKLKIIETFSNDLELKSSKLSLDWIHMLRDLYVIRLKTFFKQPPVAIWMKLVIESLAQLSLPKYETQLPFTELPKNICRHIYLAEWTSNTINAAASLSLSKYIPPIYLTGRKSKTPWGTPQNAIIDPFPPTDFSGIDQWKNLDESPVGPYLKFFQKSIILRYSSSIIPNLLSMPEFKDVRPIEVLKSFDISPDELPQYIRHLFPPESSSSSAHLQSGTWSTIYSFAESLLPWRNLGIPIGGEVSSGIDFDFDPETLSGLLSFLTLGNHV